MLGGNFGVWGGLFSTFDCAVKGVRKKEDPYNASKHTSGPRHCGVRTGLGVTADHVRT